MPRISIQRVTLETSALTDDKIYSIDGVSGTSRVKDPHIMQSVTDFATDQTGNNLRVNLTLSLQGFLQKSTKVSTKASGLWFDNINLASMVRANVYQIDEAFWIQMKSVVATPSSGFGIKLNDPAVVAYIENMFTDGQASATGPVRSISVSDILFQANTADKIKADKAKFISTGQDGSTLYNLPITLDSFVLQDPNPGFLAYLIITKIDEEMMIKGIIDTITADLPLDGPALGQLIDLSELTTTIRDLVETIAAPAATYDIIFNQKTVNNNAVVLQREDNGNLWFGNWHSMPGGTIMTGQMHNDPSLPNHNKNVILNPIQVVNTKIVDLRDDEEIEKIFLEDLYQIDNVYDKLSKINKQPRRKDGALQTELPESYSFDYMSAHSDGTYSGLICLDKSKILLNKSLHSSIANNLIKMIGGENDWTAEEVLETTISNIFSKTKIIDLRIYRKRVSSIGYGQNRLGTRSKSQNNFIEASLDADIENSYEDAVPELIGTYSDIGAAPAGITKINNINFLGPNQLFLTFKDASVKSKKKGQYQYYYEADIEDGIARELEGILGTNLGAYARLKNYVNFINSNLRKYYNDRLDKFNTQAIISDYEGPNDEDIIDIIDDCVQSLYKIWSLYGMADLGTLGVDWHMLNKLIKIASPDSGNYQGLNKFFDLFHTLLEKTLKISGCNKDVLDIKLVTRDEGNGVIKEFWTPNAGLGTIEKLNSFGAGVGTSEGRYKRTISLKETLSGIVNLDKYHGTGYEYLISDIPNPDGTTVALNPHGSIQISSDKFDQRVLQEVTKYFWPSYDKLNKIWFMNIQKYSPTFLGVAKVYLAGQMRSVNMDNFAFSTVPTVDPRPRIYPYQNNFLFYKDILLDTIRYSMMNKSDSMLDPNSTRNQVKKYIEILSSYGVSFLNNMYQQLNFIDDPAVAETSEDDFVDTSGSDEMSENSSTNSVNVVALLGDTDSQAESNIEDYEDNAAFNDAYAGKIDFLLSGILNKIVTDGNSRLSLYKSLTETQIFGGEGTENQEVATKIPNNIKSLIVRYHDSFVGSSKQLAIKKSSPPHAPLPATIFADTNRSLETLGWWWFNYSNTVKIMFIDSMDTFLKPVWRTLTIDDYAQHVNTGSSIVCKLVRYTNNNFGVRNNPLLDLPIYNEYFILRSSKLIA